MTKRKKYIVPPSLEDERELLSVIDNADSEVLIRNKSFRFKALSGFAQHKISQIITSEGQSSKDSCKCVAAAWLNGFFSLNLFYWFVWRWFYYIRQYNEIELQDAIALIKKKIPYQEYLINTILLIGMRNTMMTMNKSEVFLTLQERSGDKDGKSAKIDNGLPNP